MKYPLSEKVQQLIPVLVLVVIWMMTSWLYACADAMSCDAHDLVWKYTFSVISPLRVFAAWAITGSLILLFLNRAVFHAWLKFAAYFIPIAFILVAINPVMPAPGTFLDPFPFYRADSAALAGQIFSVATIVLVVWKYVSLRRDSKSVQGGSE